MLNAVRSFPPGGLIARAARAVGSVMARLGRERRGNVFIIVAFAMIPMVFATGMGIDYSRAARLRTKLNAIADAAALAAVTQPAMQKTDAQAKQIAIDMFNVQAEGLPDLIIEPLGEDDVQITPTADTATIGRIAKVSYVAKSINAFGGILGKPTITIAGNSTATATKAPFIDFYLLLDTSPSMLLPSTSAGLTAMRTATGCAFACHTMQPHDDSIYVRDNNGRNIWLDSALVPHSITGTQTTSGKKYVKYNNASGAEVKALESSGYYADSYWLAYNNMTFNGKPNIEMRIDAEQEAVRELVPIAKGIADDNKVSYKMATYRFDYGPDFKKLASLTKLDSTSSINSVVNASTNLPMTYWYKNSWITSSKNIDDQSTDFRTAFDKMDDEIPDPGSGKDENNPQKVLFIITDGMSDENLPGMGRTHRELQTAHLSQCTAIKSRGIRIAILYTEYLPESLTGDSWSQSNVAPHLSKVEPALRNCATNPDGSVLFQKVSTDESIAAALEALFRQTVATAHLVQ